MYFVMVIFIALREGVNNTASILLAGREMTAWIAG